jgi:hypothetical protein
MAAAGLRLTNGDLSCLAAGHIARFTIAFLRPTWDADVQVNEKLARASEAVKRLLDCLDLDVLIKKVLIRPPCAVAGGSD